MSQWGREIEIVKGQSRLVVVPYLRTEPWTDPTPKTIIENVMVITQSGPPCNQLHERAESYIGKTYGEWNNVYL